MSALFWALFRPHAETWILIPSKSTSAERCGKKIRFVRTAPDLAFKPFLLKAR